jgi:hypothetical protein
MIIRSLVGIALLALAAIVMLFPFSTPIFLVTALSAGVLDLAHASRAKAAVQ